MGPFAGPLQPTSASPARRNRRAIEGIDTARTMQLVERLMKVGSSQTFKIVVGSRLQCENISMATSTKLPRLSFCPLDKKTVQQQKKLQAVRKMGLGFRV